MKNALGIAPLAAALMLAGCLQKETTHTLYLAPDGGVRWMALERDVRSDEKDPAARRAEEDAYLAAASAGIHGIGRAFAALDPIDRQTRVIRAQRPFVVVTEAQFSSVDGLFELILSDLRVPGYVTMTRGSGTMTLLIHIDVGAATADDPGDTSPVTELCEDLALYRIVLTGGRFLRADGFRLSDDGATAVPLEITDDDVAARDGVIELTLTWESLRS